MVQTIDPRRHIPLEGGSNLRDVGGYPGADGRSVRWGAIYRSGALSRLREADWAWMRAQRFGAICDLRSDAERLLAPTDWQGGAETRHVGDAYEAERLFGRLGAPEGVPGVGEMSARVYPIFAELLAPSYRGLFRALLDGHSPVLVHCSAGQDRTGLAVGLVLTVLGVPRETIIEDYHLSTGLRRVENELDHEGLAAFADENVVARYYTDLIQRRGPAAFRPHPLLNRAGDPMLLDAFAAIEARWGSLSEYLDSELGVGSLEIRQLQDTYLE